MRARRPLRIAQDGRVVVVRGNAKTVLDAAPFRAIYNGRQRGWVLDDRRLPDLCAWLEYRRVPYEFEGAA